MVHGHIEHPSFLPTLRMSNALTSPITSGVSFPLLKTYIGNALNLAQNNGLWSVHRDFIAHIMFQCLLASDVEWRAERKSALYQVKERAEDLLCSTHRSFNLSELSDMAALLNRGDFVDHD